MTSELAVWDVQQALEKPGGREVSRRWTCAHSSFMGSDVFCADCQSCSPATAGPQGGSSDIRSAGLVSHTGRRAVPLESQRGTLSGPSCARAVWGVGSSLCTFVFTGAGGTRRRGAQDNMEHTAHIWASHCWICAATDTDIPDHCDCVGFMLAPAACISLLRQGLS